MATYYARKQSTLEFSDYSDYQNSNKGFLSSTWTPTKAQFRDTYTLSTTALTIDLARWTTVNSIIVENLDASVTIEVEYSTQESVGALSDLTFADGPPDTITSANTDFALAGVVRGEWLNVSSASNSNNDGNWLVQTVSASGATPSTITVGEDDDLTADGIANASATILNFHKNHAHVTAGQELCIHDIYITQDLTLTAASVTPDCRVTIFGS